MRPFQLAFKLQVVQPSHSHQCQSLACQCHTSSQANSFWTCQSCHLLPQWNQCLTSVSTAKKDKSPEKHPEKDAILERFLASLKRNNPLAGAVWAKPTLADLDTRDPLHGTKTGHPGLLEISASTRSDISEAVSKDTRPEVLPSRWGFVCLFVFFPQDRSSRPLRIQQQWLVLLFFWSKKQVKTPRKLVRSKWLDIFS